LKEDGNIGRGFDFIGTLGLCRSWKVGLIKYNIAGKIDFLRVGIKAPVATLIGTIVEKDTRFASEGELMGSIGVK
jgi:hypothetical protein